MTIAGWVALFLGGASCVAVIYGYAKAIVHLNGLGERLKSVEVTQEAHGARVFTLERQMDRSQDDRAGLHREVGEARRVAEESHEAADAMKTDIVGAINTMRVTMANEMGALRERVASLETVVRLRNPGTRPHD